MGDRGEEPRKAAARFRQPADALHSGRFCPFCEGNEDKTPGEVLAYRNPGSAANREGWRLRVVPNKFPALEIEGDLNKRGDGIYDMMRGVGRTKSSSSRPVTCSARRIFRKSSCARCSGLIAIGWPISKRDRRLVYGMIFKNVGAAAGASLEHTHSQLIVTPIVPVSVGEEIAGAHEFYDFRGRCVFCDMVNQELASEKRIVLDTPGFVAICPFASRFPFETWVLPKQHSSHYENIQKPAVDELARVMRQVIGRIETAVDRPAYNYILHTAPFDTSELPHYHWHIEIIPRLTNTAGFEWGTGFYINPVPPEEAAAFLREVEDRPLEVPAAVQRKREAGEG